MDGAAPPGGDYATRAHAGTLAFEMSVGRQPLVVNAGPGRVFGGDWALLARQTAAHSTVEVDGRSSARIEARGLAARTFGARLTDGPTLVSVRQAQDATGQWLLATQDGYVASHGLLQERRLYVDARGQEVRGEEILTVADARARTQFERSAANGRLGFAARFHLHPTVTPELDVGRQLVTLTLPSGEVWMFRAAGGAGRARGLGALRPGGAGAAADHAGGCPRRGGRVSRAGHLVLRPHRRAAAPRPDPVRGAAMPPDLVPIRRALVSVSDKTGLAELAAALVGARHRADLDRRHGAGAARGRAAGARRRERDRLPRDARRPGQDAAPDGPRRSARAARRPRTTRAALEDYGIGAIDLLVVNLYPFEATAAAGGDYAACVEMIDIGGPAMLRAGGQEPRLRDGRDRRRGLRGARWPSSSATGGATAPRLPPGRWR